MQTNNTLYIRVDIIYSNSESQHASFSSYPVKQFLNTSALQVLLFVPVCSWNFVFSFYRNITIIMTFKKNQQHDVSLPSYEYTMKISFFSSRQPVGHLLFPVLA